MEDWYSEENPPPTPAQAAFQRNNLLGFAILIFAALAALGSGLYLVVH